MAARRLTQVSFCQTPLIPNIRSGSRESQTKSGGGFSYLFRVAKEATMNPRPANPESSLFLAATRQFHPYGRRY